MANLTDRVGNILCKLSGEIIEHKTLKLAPENGIAGCFSRGKSIQGEIECFLNILVVSDHTIIENTITPFILCDEKPFFDYTIEPNRYHNRITVVDQHTGVIYFAADRDYSFGSDYYSQIAPPQFVITTSENRILKNGSNEKRIATYNLFGVGSVEIQKEIFEVVKRQNAWKDREKADSYFFQSFKTGETSEAVKTVVDIVNDRSLFWDLEEIWLIDPYLSSKDILKTVVNCEKYGIKIKCLTCIGTVNDNQATRIEVEEGKNKFQENKKAFESELSASIPQHTDLQLEFRTVRGSYGEPFHDRYLIMKYGINKCRAWSLGISVNALGTSHHIIQIVESPVAVADVFERIWNDTDNPECLIYSNMKKE
ncbi:MAG: hypothetical protein IKQ63_00415 [Eubacterium sp.]|nr:hypothetical protein [Eubacterium sp.]